MLEPILHTVLNNKKIILASGSPRRKELLKNIGLKFEVLPSLFDERSIDEAKYKDKKAYVLDIAESKVADVFDNLHNSSALPDLIIGADTIVELDDQVLGKPKDENQAIDFLKMLSGRSHVVHTAVVIRSLTKSKNFVESTTVTMAPLTNDVIMAYVKTGDPLDKAGAYGIQGLGGTLVEKVNGDFYNVTGLPLHRFCVNLSTLLDDL